MLRDLGWLKKVKIWDGTEVTNVTPDGRLETEAKISEFSNKNTNAFGLLKTSHEVTLNKYRYSEDEINNNYNSDVEGLGSWNIVETNGLELKTGNASSSGIELSSKGRSYYEPGKGIIFKISIILGDSGVSGNIRQWGLYNGSNGFFIRLNGTSYEFVLLSNGIETIVPASSWDIPITPNSNGHLWYIQMQWLGVGNYFLYYDGELVYTHQFLGNYTTLSIQDPDLPFTIKNYNTTNNSDVSLKSGCASVDMEGEFILSGLDDDDVLRQVKVSSGGRLLVANPPPTSPPDAIAVNRTQYDSVAVSSDDEYTIPNGETLVIQRFSGGGEVDSTAGSVVELWYDPNGTGVGMVIIDTIFASGLSDQHDLEARYIGDGIRKIRTRRRRLTGGAKLIFARWEGYY